MESCILLSVIYNGQMQLDNSKNLKDNISPSHLQGEGRGEVLRIQGHGVGGGYSKTNKLITALYMVTDIMDKEEPLRNKLRTLGVNIISDTPPLQYSGEGRGEVFKIRFITELISLLDIASAIGIISEMNHNILRKEFLELKKSITEVKEENPMWLEEFLSNSPEEEQTENEAKIPLLRGDSLASRGGYPPPPKGYSSRGESNSKGQSVNIGVQKGSTLLKALSRVEGLRVSDRNKDSNDFNVLKKQRRELILKIIKDKPYGISIKDIATALQDKGEECGEKTLQRELVSMTADGVLNKTGEKRWSRYSIKN